MNAYGGGPQGSDRTGSSVESVEVLISAPKVVITGTGRSGTTLLVQILTDLGLDTNIGSEAAVDQRVNAGLERDIESPTAPRIVKSPLLTRRLGGLLDAGKVEVEHVIVPIRQLDIAAASRVRNTKYGSNLRTPGGLMGTTRATRQHEALALLFYELFWTVARHDLPHTLLVFPRFAKDWEYTYRQLSFLDPTITPERWKETIERLADPTLIHEEPLSGEERLKTIIGTTYNRALGRPLRVLRRVLRREALKDPRHR